MIAFLLILRPSISRLQLFRVLILCGMVLKDVKVHNPRSTYLNFESKTDWSFPGIVYLRRKTLIFQKELLVKPVKIKEMRGSQGHALKFLKKKIKILVEVWKMT